MLTVAQKNGEGATICDCKLATTTSINLMRFCCDTFAHSVIAHTCSLQYLYQPPRDCKVLLASR